MYEHPKVRQAAEGSGIAQASDRSIASVTNNYNYGNVPYRPVDTDTLQEAQRRLAEMPLEEVPPLASPPQGSRILFGPNPHFVGREERYKDVARILKASEAGSEAQVVTVAITGIGGVGKSQLASEFVHRYGQYFSGGVFWLSFAEETGVPEEIAASGGAGGPGLGSDFGYLSPEDRVLRVMSAWQNSLPRLLVFDNCEDEELLQRWRPPMGGCRVLLTSRREIWSPRLGVEAVALEELRREESVALLRKHRPDLPQNDPDLADIAEELGDLPLALELAGGFLNRYHRVVSPSEYLAQLQSSELLEHPSLQKPKGGTSAVGRRERAVKRTFALSYDRLDTEDPIDMLAVALLARAALFAPGEPISPELLVKALELPEGDPEAPLRAEDALLRLRELGMLQKQDADTQVMHRLVAAFVQGTLTKEESSEILEEAQSGVEQALVDTVDPFLDEGHPTPLLAVMSHLRAVTETAKKREDERASKLCDQLGRCIHMTGAYKEARPLFERSLAIREKVLGEEHPDTAMSLSNLAVLLGAQGSYEKARPLHERALAIREKVLGEEHPDTAMSLNNLAELLRAQGSYEEARPLFERALAIYKKVLGEDHPRARMIKGKIASLNAKQRKSRKKSKKRKSRSGF